MNVWLLYRKRVTQAGDNKVLSVFLSEPTAEELYRLTEQEELLYGIPLDRLYMKNVGELVKKGSTTIAGVGFGLVESEIGKVVQYK